MNSPEPKLEYRRGEQRAWYMYDFANSAFNSTVVTLFLGPYLTELAKTAADPSGLVHPLGIPVDARSYWSYLISLSVLTQVFCLPMLGAIADYSPNKKRLLGIFAYIGAGSTIAMFALQDGLYLLGGILFLIANLAFGCSVVIYNSFLNDVAPEAERDSVSSKGWGIGYLGGGILLALNLLLFQKAEAFGIDKGMAVRISLGSAGAWWAIFGMIPMLGIRNRKPQRTAAAGENVFAKGFLQLFQTLRDMRHYPQTLTFLVAYLIYNDAIQAVITLAGQYGSDYLKIPLESLTLAILMVQFVAFGGAMLFNLLAKLFTAYRAVVLSLIIWTVLMCGVFIVKTTGDYFVAAALVAVVMGGSQALSRSLYSLMIPHGKEAEYFSLYEISDKGTSWLAPLLFGLMLQFTGSYQLAILSLVIFFLLGLGILLKVDVKRAALEAGNEA
ncbi:MFS transporter [uncultured Paludibaculum sp.]|uniref:MFS transporter n=1 Tax=uncultured Paludibaculum sp. TaxID=1765020 RepID=UPI002AABDDC2|nr:MFS transporter [uncultured Paludibaculum sp.]